MADNNGNKSTNIVQSTNTAIPNNQPIFTIQSPQSSGEGNSDQNAPSIDYDKIANILDGRMKATEESVLKGYFKEQGLSGDEMAQAIKMFKDDKASKTPDVDALTAQVAEANQRALNAEVELKATGIATELGVSSAKVPYLLKMADTDKAVKDGKIDKTKLKDALEAVLKDVPELKIQPEDKAQFGNLRVGADNDGNENNADKLNSQLATAFGVKLK